MIKIRLSRGGVRKKPFFRIVACDEKVKNKGKYLELIGFWQPAKGQISLKKETLEKWVKQGAQITPAVEKLLKNDK